MAYDFPASPANGQTYTPSGGPTWMWDGTVWKLVTPAYVQGPALATDNAIARFDLTTGKLLQNSNASVDDNGNLTIAPASVSPLIVLNKAASAAGSEIYGQMATKNRWSIHLGDGTAEGGSNAGSDFDIYRYTDAGATIDAPLTINRASGQVAFPNQLNTGNSIVCGANVTVPAAGNYYQNSVLTWVGLSYLKRAASGFNTASLLTFSILPGGNCGFAPVCFSNFSEGHVAGPAFSMRADNNAAVIASNNTGAGSHYFCLGRQGTGTMYADQTYFTASPPYDMGDGDIELFVYALVDKGTGYVGAAWCAPDPPWAYNGPTNIVPDDYRDGKGYRRVKDAKLNRKLSPREAAIALHEAPFIEIEITPEYKNSDMALIPHPFISDPAFLAGTAVPVLLDPMSDLMPVLNTMREQVGPSSVLDLVHTDGQPGALVLGNAPLKRAGPKGLMIVSAKWR